MEQQKEYYAFISYKREDEKWAKWLANELEHYHLPTTLNGKELPKNLRPVFRDVDELSAGNLPVQIYHALSNSKNLIVVCSPRAANSEWVNKEIEDFIKIKGGKAENIYPFIIEGTPFAKDSTRECFPKALRNLSGNEERLGGNVNETGGKNVAVVKTIAGMLGVSHDSLWNRYEREQRKKRNWIITAAIIAFLGVFGIASWMYWQNQQIQKANWKMMENQARAVAEKASQLIEEGDFYTARLLACDVLPDRTKNKIKPYTMEAEVALRKALSHNNAILKGHTSCVSSAMFSPNGKRIISASDDETIRLWDFQTGRLLQIIEGHFGTVHFSPNGKFFVSTSDKTVSLWDSQTCDTLMTLEGHTGHVSSAIFSSDGKRIATSSFDKTTRIWDVQTGHLLKILKGHTDFVSDATFSPDGKKIATASSDKTVRIWDVQTGKLILTLIGHTDHVNSVVFSPDGKQILSGSDDHTIKIWDSQTGKLNRTLKGHTGSVNSLSFRFDGKQFVSASSDETLKLWDVEKGRLLQTMVGHTGSVYSAAFSPDGMTIVSASCDETIRLWDVKIGNLLQNIEVNSGIIESIAYSPDGKTIVSVSDDEIVRLWDAYTGILLQTLDGHVNDADNTVSNHGEPRLEIKRLSESEDTITEVISPSIKHSVCFSSSGKKILLTLGEQIIRGWDAQTGKLLLLDGNEDTYDSIVYSPIWNKYVYIQCLGNSINIISVSEKGKVMQTLKGHSSFITSAASSPDGKKVVSASFDKTIKIWDVQTGKLIQTLEGHTGGVLSVAFSPDGKRIASSSDDGTIKIWRFPPLQQLIDETGERFKDRKLTPEERWKYYLE